MQFKGKQLMAKNYIQHIHIKTLFVFAQLIAMKDL